MVTSDDHDKKVRRTTEKGLRLYERLGPDFRGKYPREDFIDYQRIEKGPDREHANFGRTSGAADFNTSKVNLRKAALNTARDKTEQRREAVRILIALARPYASELKSKQRNYLNLAKRLKGHDIPRKLKAATEKPSRDIDALLYLDKRSEGSLYKLIRKHKAEILSVSP